MQKQHILTGVISSMLVTLALSQVSYGNESIMSQQKVSNDISDAHSLSVQTKTSKIAMFNKQAKPHKHPTGKKGK